MTTDQTLIASRTDRAMEFSGRMKAAITELDADEVLQRFNRRVAKGMGKPVTVLDFLGEQRAMSYAALQGRYEMRRFDAPISTIPLIQVGMGLLARRSIPFIWTHEMRQLALAYTVPRHPMGPSSFPHHAMWWSFETALGDPTGGQVDGFLIIRNAVMDEVLRGVVSHPSDGWEVLAVGSDDLRRGPLWIRREWSAPDGTLSDVLGEHAVLLGLSAFLNSHFVSVQRKTPGQEMKTWRGRRIGDPAALNVVTLRSSVREAVDVERGLGPEWKQRWLVRGHFRAQWYPADKSHRVIWIAPYLKGPEDAPLKLPVYRVAR